MLVICVQAQPGAMVRWVGVGNVGTPTAHSGNWPQLAPPSMNSALSYSRAAASTVRSSLLGRPAARVPGISPSPSTFAQRQVRAMATEKVVIATDKAPAALGPYSQAIKAGNTVYCSGQIGIVSGTKDFASPDVEGQTEQVLKNLGGVLEAAGASYGHVVKTTVLLADIADFPKVNAIYAKYFTDKPPARATYAVKDLPLGARVEIEAIAVL